MDSSAAEPDADRGQAGIFMALVIAAVALVMFTVVLLLGIGLVGGIVDGTGQAPTNATASPDPVTAQSVSFQSLSPTGEIETVYRVRDSRNYSVALTGASDSFVSADADISVASDDSWSVSTWAYVDSGAASANMTAVSVDGRVLIQYNGSRSDWSVWYYDEAGRNSYRVNVSAPNQPATWGRIEARHNGSHLTVFRNTTQGETVSTSGSNLANATTNAANWDGRLDETRTFDDALNSSQRSTLVSDPVAPLPGTNRTARLMYDQGSGTNTPIYFAGTSATLSNATWAGGLNGSRLEAGTDYTVNKQQGTITALAGGAIDGAPVVFIEYRFADAVGQLGQRVIGAFDLFAVGALLIPAVAVLAVLVGGVSLAVTQISGGEGGDERRFNGR